MANTTGSEINTTSVASVWTEADPQALMPWETSDPFVSARATRVSELVVSCALQQVVMVLGIPGNILTLCVFFKQGLKDRVNLLLFSLAIADEITLLSQFLYKSNCYLLPFDSVVAANWRVQMTPQVMYFGLCTNFVSGMLIVVMAVDRCLSVVIPLKASRILSFGRMLTVILLVYTVILACFSPLFFQFTVGWRLDPATNRSLAFVILVPDYPLDLAGSTLITKSLSVVVQPASLVIVVICSFISIVKLRQATRRRVAMSKGEGGGGGKKQRGGGGRGGRALGKGSSGIGEEGASEGGGGGGGEGGGVGGRGGGGLRKGTSNSIRQTEMGGGEGGQSGGRGGGGVERGRGGGGKGEGRQGKGTTTTTTPISQTESRITQMLIFLCIVYVVCILPIAVVTFVYTLEPQFYLYGKYHNTFVLVYNVIHTSICFNASANFFAYLALSSRFRATLLATMPCCARFLSKTGGREAAKKAMRSSDSAVSANTSDSVVNQRY